METALIGLLGIVIGAGLQSLASLWLSKRERVRNEQLEAYKAFLTAVSRGFDDREFLAKDVIKDDDFRRACLGIGIFGSSEVVLAVSQLVEWAESENQYFDFLRLYELIRAMRKDLSGFDDEAIKSDIFVMAIAGDLHRRSRSGDETQKGAR